MTDKQIIIDDCIHLDKWKHCNICGKLIKTKDGANGKKREHLLTEEDLRCDFYPNCYYKQLQRAEKTVEECHKYQAGLEDKIEAKEQECEELKNKNYELAEEVSIDRALFAEIDKLKTELEQEKALKETYLACYKAKHEDIEGKLFKLKQTLTEIKTDILYTREGISYFWVIDKCDEILQKISECEV